MNYSFVFCLFQEQYRIEAQIAQKCQTLSLMTPKNCDLPCQIECHPTVISQGDSPNQTFKSVDVSARKKWRQITTRTKRMLQMKEPRIKEETLINKTVSKDHFPIQNEIAPHPPPPLRILLKKKTCLELIAWQVCGVYSQSWSLTLSETTTISQKGKKETFYFNPKKGQAEGGLLAPPPQL